MTGMISSSFSSEPSKFTYIYLYVMYLYFTIKSYLNSWIGKYIIHMEILWWSWIPEDWINGITHYIVPQCHYTVKLYLVGGFNPVEKY